MFLRAKTNRRHFYLVLSSPLCHTKKTQNREMAFVCPLLLCTHQNNVNFSVNPLCVSKLNKLVFNQYLMFRFINIWPKSSNVSLESGRETIFFFTWPNYLLRKLKLLTSLSLLTNYKLNNNTNQHWLLHQQYNNLVFQFRLSKSPTKGLRFPPFWMRRTWYRWKLLTNWVWWRTCQCFSNEWTSALHLVSI